MTVVREKTAPSASPRRVVKKLRWLLPALGVLAWLLTAGVMSGPSGKVADVQKNDNSAFLPKTAEATEVLELNKKFVNNDVVPAIVIYGRDSGLTEADKSTIGNEVKAIEDHFGATLAGDPMSRTPLISQDGKAAQVLILFNGTDSKKNVEHVNWIRDHIGGADTSGDQARAPVDGAIPQRAGGVVVGVAGPDQPASEPLDLRDCSGWCRHRALLSRRRHRTALDGARKVKNLDLTVVDECTTLAM